VISITQIIGFALGALLSALCLQAEAQQSKKVRKIGYLSSTERATESARAEGIRTALRELGYIEGQNITIEYRYAEGKPDRYPHLAAELVRLKVDVIVIAGGLGTIRAAKNATKAIPVVMAGSGSDPVEAGLVESLAHPGGNVSGLTNLTRELGGKRLELLKQSVPKLATAAVLYDPATSVVEVEEVLPVAVGALGLTVRSWEVRGTDGFEKVFAGLNKQRPDGLYVPTSPLMRANQKRIAGFALKIRLPSVGGNTEYVDAGGLMSYDADAADSCRLVAIYVDKISTELSQPISPVQQPRKFELVINTQDCKADRPHHSSQCAGESEPSDQVNIVVRREW